MTISRYDDTKSEIQIVAVYFRNQNKPGNQGFESYPKRMVMDGREYNFVETGMRYLVRKGQELVKLFDVSDGNMQYRLRLDGQDHWTLVNMKAAA